VNRERTKLVVYIHFGDDFYGFFSGLCISEFDGKTHKMNLIASFFIEDDLKWREFGSYLI
jgi:hypothetical protein